MAYILSLKIAPELERELTALRTRHFPPERNFLSAHITLFHALPDAERERWQADIARIAEAQARFEFKVAAAFSLGRGAAFRIVSPELLSVREELARSWDFLSAQDQQGYRPHCTIQNKVTPEEARATLQNLVVPEPTGVALGLTLSLYANGPWKFERDFFFKAFAPEVS